MARADIRPSRVLTAAVLLLLLFAAVQSRRVAAAPTIPTDPASLKQAATLYQQKCAACHGLKGKGDGPVARTLTTRPADFSAGEFKQGDTDDAVFKSISTGVPGTQMAGWKGRLSETEISGLIGYIRSMKP